MSSLVRVGLVQCARPPGPGDDGMPALERAADLGVRILVFPEARPEDGRPPEPLDGGPTVRALAALARRYGIVVVAPLVEAAPGGSGLAAAVIDADGTLAGAARRVHVPPWERAAVVPGEGGWRVVPTRAGRIGVLLGHDRRFPEAGRCLGLQAPDLVLVADASAEGPADPAWEAEIVALAAGNRCFAGVANRPSPGFGGGSFFVGPTGRVLVRGSRERADLLWADLDLDDAVRARAAWDPLADRRPVAYRPLVES